MYMSVYRIVLSLYKKNYFSFLSNKRYQRHYCTVGVFESEKIPNPEVRLDKIIRF